MFPKVKVSKMFVKQRTFFLQTLKLAKKNANQKSLQPFTTNKGFRQGDKGIANKIRNQQL